MIPNIHGMNMQGMKPMKPRKHEPHCHDSHQSYMAPNVLEILDENKQLLTMVEELSDHVRTIQAKKQHQEDIHRFQAIVEKATLRYKVIKYQVFLRWYRRFNCNAKPHAKQQQRGGNIHVKRDPPKQFSTVKIGLVNYDKSASVTKTPLEPHTTMWKRNCKKLKAKIQEQEKTIEELKQKVAVVVQSKASTRVEKKPTPASTLEKKKPVEEPRSRDRDATQLILLEQKKIAKELKKENERLKIQSRSFKNTMETKVNEWAQANERSKRLKAQLENYKVQITRLLSMKRALESQIETLEATPHQTKTRARLEQQAKRIQALESQLEPFLVNGGHGATRPPGAPQDKLSVPELWTHTQSDNGSSKEKPVDDDPPHPQVLSTLQLEPKVEENSTTGNNSSKILGCTIQVLLFIFRLKHLVKRTARREKGRRDDGLGHRIFSQDVTGESIKTMSSSSNESTKKSPATIDFLASALRKVSLLDALTKVARRTAAQAMESAKFRGGENVMVEGETGDVLYILDKGKLDVFVAKQKVNEISQRGTCFGELAIVLSATRSATIVTKCSTALWSLDRKTFRTLLAAHSQHHVEEVTGALRQVALLSGLSDQERVRVASAVQVETFRSGVTILTKGEVGDKFYMIQSGQCLVKDGDFGQSNLTLAPGTYFGERALLNDEPRAATILASTSQVTCLTLDRASFNQVLGPLASLLKKNRIMDEIRVHPIFERTEAHLVSRLAMEMEMEEFKTGTTMIEEGAPATKVYFLREGTAYTTHQEHHETTQEHVYGQSIQPGTLFGVASILGFDHYTGSVISKSTVKCYTISLSVLASIHPTLSSTLRSKYLRHCFPELEYCPDSIFHHVEPVLYSPSSTLQELGQPLEYLHLVMEGQVLSRETNEVLSCPCVFEPDLPKLSTQTIEAKTSAACLRLSTLILQKSCGSRNIRHAGRTLSNNHSPEVPWTLSELTIVRCIGQRVSGPVYLVVRQEEPYAMTKVHKTLIQERHQDQYLVNEVKVLKTVVGHPNVVQFVTTFQDSEYIYLVLEYVPGGDFVSTFERCFTGVFLFEECKFYSACVVSALGYCHEREIVVRNLAPEHLAIDMEGYLRLNDFGSAKVLGHERTYTLLGYPEYLAPEIILGAGYTQAVDLWSLGILLYEMAYGATPFYDKKNNNQLNTVKKVVKGKLKFPRIHGINADGQDLIRQLLEKNPTKRLGCFQSGVQDVKDHPWFDGIDFEALVERRISAPWRPVLKNNRDSSYYAECPDKVPEVDSSTGSVHLDTDGLRQSSTWTLGF